MRRVASAVVLTCLAAILARPLAHGQEMAPVPGTVILRVSGLVPRSLALTAPELAQLPRATVTGTDRSGQAALFEGVSLDTILRAAGITFGERLRGSRLAEYVLVTAAAGYRVVFALPELDPAFATRIVLLADRRNGQPLLEREGPLMVVVPGDQRHARWVRQVVELRVKRSE